MTLERIQAVAVFDPFKAMDMLDDVAILAELEGQVVDKWVYHFPQEGKEVWGLSKVGVDQACREMALQGEVIREEDVFYQLDPTDNRFVLFKAFASRVAVSKDGGEVSLDRTTGTKRQCVFQVTQKEGITNRPNAFWFEQGSIKALRNARLRLISEEIRAKIMSMAKSKGKVTEVKGEKQQPKPDPEQERTELKSSPVAEETDNLPEEAVEPAPQIDSAWLKETLEIIHWKESTALSWMKAHLKASGNDLMEVLNSLDNEQRKVFVGHISSMREASGR